MAAVWAIKKGWLAPGWQTMMGVAAPPILAVVTAHAHYRFLRDADELRRKIELEAMALAYGASVVGVLTYWLLDFVGVVNKDHFLWLIEFTILAYPACSFFGRRRYR